MRREDELSEPYSFGILRRPGFPYQASHPPSKSKCSRLDRRSVVTLTVNHPQNNNSSLEELSLDTSPFQELLLLEAGLLLRSDLNGPLQQRDKLDSREFSPAKLSRNLAISSAYADYAHSRMGSLSFSNASD